MNRQYCDGRLSGMNALTAQRFISVQPGGVTLEFFWDHACSKNRGKGGTFEVKTRTAFSGKRGVISDRVPRFPYLGVFFISLYFRV